MKGTGRTPMFEMRDIPRPLLRQAGFWAHLTGPVPNSKAFLWRCYEEAPGGGWTDRVLDEGGDAFMLNTFEPPRYPWVVPLRLHNGLLVFGQRDGVAFAQLVAREYGNSFAWRKQAILTHPMTRLPVSQDAEDMPHSNAYDANGAEPPVLPFNVPLSPRYVPNEFMFYTGRY